jgi:hypothetical protein
MSIQLLEVQFLDFCSKISSLERARNPEVVAKIRTMKQLIERLKLRKRSEREVQEKTKLPNGKGSF